MNKNMSTDFEYKGIRLEPLSVKATIRKARDYFRNQPDKSMEMRMKILRYCVWSHCPHNFTDWNGNNAAVGVFWFYFQALKMELLENIPFHLYCQEHGYDPYIISDHKVWVGKQMSLETYYGASYDLNLLEPIFTEENCEADNYTMLRGRLSVWRDLHILGIDENGKYYYPYTAIPISNSETAQK